MNSKIIKKTLLSALSLLMTFGAIQSLSSHDVEAMNSPVALIDESTINKGYSAKAELYELDDYDKIVILYAYKFTTGGCGLRFNKPPVIDQDSTCYCDYTIKDCIGREGPYIDFGYSFISNYSIEDICENDWTGITISLDCYELADLELGFEVPTYLLYNNAIVIDIDENDQPYYYFMQKRNKWVEVEVFFDHEPKGPLESATGMKTKSQSSLMLLMILQTLYLTSHITLL